MIIIQLVLLIFTAIVFVPLFGTFGTEEALRFVFLSPFAITALVLNLIITLIRLIRSIILRKQVGTYLNLIIFLINIILGVVLLLQ